MHRFNKYLFSPLCDLVLTNGIDKWVVAVGGRPRSCVQRPERRCRLHLRRSPNPRGSKQASFPSLQGIMGAGSSGCWYTEPWKPMIPHVHSHRGCRNLVMFPKYNEIYLPCWRWFFLCYSGHPETSPSSVDLSVCKLYWKERSGAGWSLDNLPPGLNLIRHIYAEAELGYGFTLCSVDAL